MKKFLQSPKWFPEKVGLSILSGSLLLLFFAFVISCEPVKQKELTKNEVVTLVTDGVRLIQEKGEAVFPDLEKMGSKWRAGDAYVFVADMEGKFTVHPNPELVGVDMIDLQDDNGKPIVQWFIKKALSEKQGGWTHYLWKKQGEEVPTWKSTYVELATAPDGSEYVVGCGAYDIAMEKEFAMEAVEEAIELMAAEGDSVAFVQMREKSSPFLFKGTYIFVMDTAYTLVVDPPFPELEGTNVYEYQDSNGKYLFQEFMQVANDQGAGWVDYMWPKPGDTVPSSKSSYIKMVVIDGEPYIVGMGMYLAEEPSTE
ncbi:MAG: cache domain-containing protein [Bacteroidia bacterium]|nr:cache domain-containing protein [Bacteroidia bacterium]